MPGLVENEVVADPFHVELVESPPPETTPAAEASVETSVPDTIPAPVDEHPEPQPEFVPSARRVQE